MIRNSFPFFRYAVNKQTVLYGLADESPPNLSSGRNHLKVHCEWLSRRPNNPIYHLTVVVLLAEVDTAERAKKYTNDYLYVQALKLSRFFLFCILATNQGEYDIL